MLWIGLIAYTLCLHFVPGNKNKQGPSKFSPGMTSFLKGGRGRLIMTDRLMIVGIRSTKSGDHHFSCLSEAFRRQLTFSQLDTNGNFLVKSFSILIFQPLKAFLLNIGKPVKNRHGPSNLIQFFSPGKMSSTSTRS